MTNKSESTGSLLGLFLSYFKKHRGLFVLDISCAFLIALIDLAFPLISRTAMYQWLPEKKYTVFFAVMAVVVVAFLLRAGLYYVVGYWGHTFGIRVEADIRRDLFEHMQELGFDFYDRNRTGQLMSRVTTDLFEIAELAHHGPEDLLVAEAGAEALHHGVGKGNQPRVPHHAVCLIAHQVPYRQVALLLENVPEAGHDIVHLLGMDEGHERLRGPIRIPK